MPELPEVETVRQGLKPSLENAVIIGVEMSGKNLRFPFPENLEKEIVGRKIYALERRAKYLLIVLDNNRVLISHLGMSGSWRVDDDSDRDCNKTKLSTHDHFIMELKQGDNVFRVIYNDPRRFGFLLLSERDQLDEHALLKKLGIEPTGNGVSGEYLREAFAGKRAPLKSALLDQSLVAGLGNIYVCEALWRAGLAPDMPAHCLSQDNEKAIAASEKLAHAIYSVIAEAIEAGGSSLRDYMHTDGSLGYFQHKFSVYGREGQVCFRCGAFVQRMVQGGRSTFYCASCQEKIS